MDMTIKEAIIWLKTFSAESKHGEFAKETAIEALEMLDAAGGGSELF